MIKINSIPKQVCCANCGSNLRGRSVTVSHDGHHMQSVTLCAKCLEKAARVLRDEERTNQVVFTLTRYANNSFLSTIDCKVYHNAKEATDAYIETFEADLQYYKKELREQAKKTFEKNLANEIYIYTITKENTEDIIHVEMATQILR